MFSTPPWPKTPPAGVSAASSMPATAAVLCVFGNTLTLLQLGYDPTTAVGVTTAVATVAVGLVRALTPAGPTWTPPSQGRGRRGGGRQGRTV